MEIAEMSKQFHDLRFVNTKSEFLALKFVQNFDSFFGEDISGFSFDKSQKTKLFLNFLIMKMWFVI